MCGIVGVLRLSDKKIKKSEVEKSLNLISYRGPDAFGIYEDEKIVLGHRRLAIIDLSSSANQPMELHCAKTDKNFIIVFNGEIYNYRELLRSLENLGHRFNSKSDTEVILHSYEEWGNDCLKKFRGMFAIALWDKRNSQLVLARDRFGIKPLYYYQDDNFLIFASEIKAILNLAAAKKEINPNAIFSFLRQGWIPQPETFYKNIFVLEAGTFAARKRENGKWKWEVKKYADIAEDFSQNYEEITLEKAIEKTKSALLDTISTHLVSDVEVGAFLSGGIDSSVLVALMRELKQEKITTVSAISPGTAYNESEKIKLIANKFQTNHINLEILAGDFLEHLDSIFFHMDEPTIDGINTYLVSLAAKKAGLKVVLSGLGGDELFYGYPSFIDIPKIIRFTPLLKNAFVQKILDYKLRKDAFNQRIAKLREFVRGNRKYTNSKQIYEYEKWLRSNRGYTNSKQIYELMNVYLIYRGLFTDGQIKQILNQQIENCELKNGSCEKNQSDICEAISCLELTEYMKNQLLRDADVFSMAHSIELRVPFVDNVLLGTITKIPAEFKMKNGIQKFLLKEALKNQLPEKILSQKKQGFVLPMDLWLRNEARDLIKNEILNSKVLELKTTKLLLDKFYQRKLHWSRLWSLFVLNRFVKNF